MLKAIVATLVSFIPEDFGNRHVAVDDHRLMVIRCPGRYRGKHRRY